MKISSQLLRKIESDLALNAAFRKGEDIPVANCWHFCTDGNAVDAMFYGRRDFIDGMNRIYLAFRKYPNVTILAFVLMDTHFHLVMHGDYNDCNNFVHEYLRRTSMYISFMHGDRKKLLGIPVCSQRIDTDIYLKKAICYVIKNPTSAGLSYLPYDYPWSSGALYFRKNGLWTSPVWRGGEYYTHGLENMGILKRRSYLRCRDVEFQDVPVSKGLIFPGEFVAVEIVERVFRTCRSFNYFMGNSREDDMDSHAMLISRLSMPIQEIRQHRNELSLELFGKTGLRNFDMAQRVKLARALRKKYGCSAKQVCKVCGLIHDEVKGGI